jgi:hypothetical protein
MSAAQVAKYTDVNVKEYLFQLISGPDVTSTFLVCPRDYASAGYFMNHGKEKKEKGKKYQKNINVKASIVIANAGPIIIFQAMRKIKYGEELVYNYNGNFDSYDTTTFE